MVALVPTGILELLLIHASGPRVQKFHWCTSTCLCLFLHITQLLQWWCLLSGAQLPGHPPTPPGVHRDNSCPKSRSQPLPTVWQQVGALLHCCSCSMCHCTKHHIKTSVGTRKSCQTHLPRMTDDQQTRESGMWVLENFNAAFVSFTGTCGVQKK